MPANSSSEEAPPSATKLKSSWAQNSTIQIELTKFEDRYTFSWLNLVRKEYDRYLVGKEI